MNPIHLGELENNISSATVVINDTGEIYNLSIKPNSHCHFFKRFTVENDDIQLRLDWSDKDENGQPTLDADFINRETGKHRSIQGERKVAHHTNSLTGKGRSYKWAFENCQRHFSVIIVWLAKISEEAKISDFITTEIVSKKY